MSSKPQPVYTIGEEVCNSVTHGLGALFSIIGGTVIITLSAVLGDSTAVFSSSVFALSLTMLYSMSALYHAFSLPKLKKTFRIFDHASIFLLIAGTYTPFCLVALDGNTRAQLIISLVWACAIGGVVMCVTALNKTEKINFVLYIIMGWGVVFVLKDVVSSLDMNGVILLVLGGLSYTVGIIFYKMKHIKYMHSVWHLFVLGGSAFHYLCVAFYVLPLSY